MREREKQVPAVKARPSRHLLFFSNCKERGKPIFEKDSGDLCLYSSSRGDKRTTFGNKEGRLKEKIVLQGKRETQSNSNTTFTSTHCRPGGGSAEFIWGTFSIKVGRAVGENGSLHPDITMAASHIHGADHESHFVTFSVQDNQL